MKHSDAISKFNSQVKMIKGSAMCFIEDLHGRELEELGAFFNTETNIKSVVVIKDSKLCMLVSPHQYYLAGVLGSQYAITNELNNIELVLPTGETTTNFSAVVKNAQGTQLLDEKTLKKIETYDENSPF